MAHYAFLNNDHTTETLREELMVLSNEMGNLTSVEEQDTAAIETKQAEIDSKQEEIDNCLCVVTGVITGVSEIKYEVGRDEEFEQEMIDLYHTRVGKTPEEVAEIEAEAKQKIEEKGPIPSTEIDNTVYWEGYYGKGGLCKRTSYNTIGGVHKNGGTPFRKNYAGTGYTYDPVRDAFYAPQPFESWTLNEESCLWECPVERPEGEYWWKEDTTEWVDYEYYSQPYNSVAPYPSWSWSTETGWTAPVEKVEGRDYWSEENQMWLLNPVSSQPYPSWNLEDVNPVIEGDIVRTDWVAPTQMPNDAFLYIWDEETLTWIEQ